MGIEEWLVKAVMIMYKKARTMVKTKDGNSDKFEVKVGVHRIASEFIAVCGSDGGADARC